MVRIALLLALVAAPISPLRSQAASASPAAPTCLPSATLEEFVKALDDAISGPADKDRTCLRQVVLPEARLTPLVPAADGSLAPRILPLDDWIANIAKRGHSSLFERQTKVRIQRYGSLAHLWTTFELRDTPDGAPLRRGINSIQAVWDGSRWRLYGVLWQNETPDVPLSKEDLP